MKVTCPSCKSSYFVEDGMAGAHLKCRQCGWFFDVPVRSTGLVPLCGEGVACGLDLSNAKMEFDLGVLRDGGESLHLSCTIHHDGQKSFNVFATADGRRTGIYVRLSDMQVEALKNILGKVEHIFSQME